VGFKGQIHAPMVPFVVSANITQLNTAIPVFLVVREPVNAHTFSYVTGYLSVFRHSSWTACLPLEDGTDSLSRNVA
jgi:hypothetical protein